MNNSIMEALLALALHDTKHTELQVMDIIKNNNLGLKLDYDKVIKLRDEMAGLWVIIRINA